MLSIPRSVPKPVPRLLAVLLVVALLPGCYYVQAARGHLQIMNAREPIADVVADPDTPPAVRTRLADVEAARAFAIDALALPDNGSYTSYVDLGRDYVVVNVFAAPEFSLVPRLWCYPFVGCTAYRGYFAADDAEAYAARLAARGYDTATSRVRAYSTLGRFEDPVLSTMIDGSSDATVSLMFHELAHQVVYVADDTAFNESFASFVASEGLRRWRERGGRSMPPAAASARSALRDALDGLRERLTAVYEAPIDERTKRERKAALFEGFAQTWRELGARPPAPDNNAALLPLALYDDRRAAFAALLDACAGALPCLYRRVRELADLDKPERDARLDALAAASTVSGGGSGAGGRTVTRGPRPRDTSAQSPPATSA